ncbi:hypothetical protein SBI_08817 [Streptomyces bingchenggensis BCW-1]|uniref:Uncharacterized protein n=1 Tax=Streptomyces bingchenggensis (strain BCW-1) TaxID=749414 RepID=D7BY55_STRBB|nr:hypothetical protein SBI_08817 [Streptomyces bingchenggensis BCW-1]
MPSRSSSVSSRLTFAGTPATSEPGGTCIPCGTSACAATREPAPTRAPLSTVAPMPTSTSSSMTQPCSTALWPTETRSPTVAGKPGSACIVQLSWILLPAPTLIASASPRSTAWYQTLAPAPSVTSPITTDVGAANASGSTFGSLPPTPAINARSVTAHSLVSAWCCPPPQ